ncbi:MAG: hypothetical protein OXC95_07855 [Dehalococcoidia bacterium]|nr:hypothetical protein [Dehalococcoidia bacterium]
MDFLSDHWGSVFSVIGVVVSVVGLAWAILEAHSAKSAAQAAEQATVETRDSIGRYLAATDLARAIGLIQRLKLLHRESRWEAALEQYQAVRAIISSIAARHPDLETETKRLLALAREQISVMEDYVETQVSRSLEPDDMGRLNRQLNQIQSHLEDTSSTMDLGDNSGGDRHE